MVKIIEIDGKELVAISQERYNDLLDTEAYACALDSAGVDNWSGYSFAMELLDEQD